MTKVEELLEYLSRCKLRIGGIYPAHEVTAEEIADEIIKSLKKLETGEFTIEE